MISITQVGACLTHQLYFKLLVYDLRSFLGQSSVIFRNLRKFSENIWKPWCGFRITFVESSEILGKWLEIFEKLSKKSFVVC